MIRYSILVDGRVQGVGFRYQTQALALKYGLTGWVKNMEYGMVRMEVQGIEEKVESFLEELSKGNRFIRVDRLEKKEMDIQDSESKFKISY